VAWPIGRPASSHACPASKDTHARASAKHHTRAIMPKQGAVIRKQASKGSMHANKAKQALCDAREGMYTSTRAAVRRPSSICSHRGESAGRSARCQGPDLVMLSRCSVSSVECVVAGRLPPAVGPIAHTSCPCPELPHCVAECEVRPRSAVLVAAGSVEAGLVRRLITRRRAHGAPLNRGQRPFLSASMQGSAGLRRRFALCAGDPRLVSTCRAGLPQLRKKLRPASPARRVRLTCEHIRGCRLSLTR